MKVTATIITKLLQHLIKINSEPGQTDLENSLINLQRRRLLIKKLAANIEAYAGEVKNLLNRRIGKGTYDALPNSIKEALIDLNYNKGLSK